MKPRELKALIKTLRSLGVVSYEADGVKLLLDPNFVTASQSKRIRSANKAKDAGDLQEQFNGFVAPPTMTDDEWLLATNLPNPEDEQVQ